MFEITIDRTLELPVYKQIIEQITLKVQNGQLLPGTQVPAERELAKQLDTARGTVAKAYTELVRSQVIEVVQGKGSFVSKRMEPLDESRKEKAVRMINDVFDQLTALNFSEHEIRIFLDLLLLEREEKHRQIKIATIDCNPEALHVFKRQLGYLKDVVIESFLLEDFVAHYGYPDLERLVASYDLLVTTSTHYQSLLEQFNHTVPSLLQVAVAPSQQTILDLSKFQTDQDLGILCESEAFEKIILRTLSAFNISRNHIHTLRRIDIHRYMKGVRETTDLKVMKDFLRDHEQLIVPPILNWSDEEEALLDQFKRRKGALCQFDYQIERGALIYIEESIMKVMRHKEVE